MPIFEIVCSWIERCCFLNSETVTASCFVQINSEPYCALVQYLYGCVQLLDEVSLQSDQTLVCFDDKSEWVRFNVSTPHTKPNACCNSMNFHRHSICRLPTIGMVSCRILRSPRFFPGLPCWQFHVEFNKFFLELRFALPLRMTGQAKRVLFKRRSLETRLGKTCRRFSQTRTQLPREFHRSFWMVVVVKR